MSEFSESLKERSMAFAEAVLRLVDRLPPSPSGRVIAHQLASSATAVTSNYRATCNARSRREFIAKLGVVVEEADESVCWLELMTRREMLPRHEVQPVLRESVELRNIFGKSLGTARANSRSQDATKVANKRTPIKRPTNQLTN